MGGHRSEFKGVHKHPQLVLTLCHSLLCIHVPYSGDINLSNGNFIGTFHDYDVIELKCSNNLKCKTF